MLSGVNYQSGNTYTFLPIDATRVTIFTSDSTVNAVIPSPVMDGFGKGTVFTIMNHGNGTVFVTCTTCTITVGVVANSVLQLNARDATDLYSDGDNYSGNLVIGGGGGGGGGSSAFNAITSGANTTATMSVDTGAILAPINSGQIRASAFAGINAAQTSPSPAGTSTCPTGSNPFGWTQNAAGTFQ